MFTAAPVVVVPESKDITDGVLDGVFTGMLDVELLDLGGLLVLGAVAPEVPSISRRCCSRVFTAKRLICDVLGESCHRHPVAESHIFFHFTSSTLGVRPKL